MPASQRYPPGLTALAELFDDDRRSLEQLLDDVAHLCRLGSYSSAAKVFGGFRRLVDRQLAEEERLVAECRAAGHCPGRLAHHVSQAHAELKQLIETAWVGVTRRNGISYGDALAALRGGIDAHERFEREELLPVLSSHCRGPRELERAVHTLVDD